jgi:amino acid transporter
LNTQPDATTTAFLAAYFGFIAIFFLVFFVLSIVIQWRIAAKAGYNAALSLLMLVPLVNLIMLCIFAFTEWPIEKALKLAREGGGGPPQWYPPSGAPPPTVPYLPPPAG